MVFLGHSLTHIRSGKPVHPFDEPPGQIFQGKALHCWQAKKGPEFFNFKVALKSSSISARIEWKLQSTSIYNLCAAQKMGPSNTSMDNTNLCKVPVMFFPLKQHLKRWEKKRTNFPSFKFCLSRFPLLTHKRHSLGGGALEIGTSGSWGNAAKGGVEMEKSLKDNISNPWISRSKTPRRR